MREYWMDHHDRQWSIVRSSRRLKFKYPAHAALRSFVFRRDGFQCRRCDARAIDVPHDYDGRFALFTNTKTGAGTQDVLVLDHVLTLRAGGTSTPGNLQTLCETCNRRKQKEDKTAALRAMSRRA